MIYDIPQLLSAITEKVARKENRDDTLEAITSQMATTQRIYKKYGTVTALNALLNR